MREENFIAFWTVFGFFVGLMIGLFQCTDAFDILAITLLSTLFCYLMAHVSVAVFIRFIEFGKIDFEKESYDKKLDFFYNQLLQRESQIDSNQVCVADNVESMEGKDVGL